MASRKQRIHMKRRQRRLKAFSNFSNEKQTRVHFQQYFETWKKNIHGGDHAYVVTMDLARFHTINKRFSYEMGDRVLQYVYRTLISHSPSNCSWMKLGSDTFIALITGKKSADEIEKLIVEWKKAVEKPFEIDGFEFMLTVVFGVAAWPKDGTDFLQLVKSADTALREAKNNELAILKWYEPIFCDRIVNAFEIEKQIRLAIENKEFELYYQPQWDVKNRRWGGLEVLVRWLHPSRGLLSPDKFIDIAEETGLIHPLGDWIIREACKQHAINQKQMGCHDLPISINFSIKQLMTANFLENLLDIVTSSNLRPEHFVIELTESVAIDVEKAKTLLTEAKKYGFKISIDDFGTGYTAVQYLLDLPIDEIKIDRSFVGNGFIDDEKKKRLAHWLVQLGEVLNVDIVAEGVETKEQFEILKKWGCDKLQGYYFSKPIPAKSLHQFLQNICYD